MVVPRSNDKAVLPVLCPAVNDVLASVNDQGLLASGFLVAAVVPVVGPNIERIEPLVDSLREIGAGGFAVIQLAVETVRSLKALIAVVAVEPGFDSVRQRLQVHYHTGHDSFSFLTFEFPRVHC